jgi:hypothetical protein
MASFDMMLALRNKEWVSRSQCHRKAVDATTSPGNCSYRMSPSLFRGRVLSEDHLMTRIKTATLLILFALATAGANSALAEGAGFRAGGSFHGRGDSGAFRRGHHWRRPPMVTGGFIGIDGYGSGGGYGYGGGGYGNGGAIGNGYGGDWYGISSGHDDCPRFRQRVRTPEGWQVQTVPVC